MFNIKSIKTLLVAALLTLGAITLQAQDARQLFDTAVNTWDVLSNNISGVSLQNEKDEEGVRTVGGSGVFFGHAVGFELAYHKDKEELRRIMIEFPDAANLNTDQFRAIFGKSVNEVFPEGFGLRMGIQHFEMDLENKKVENAYIRINMGSWAPGDDEAVTLSDITAEFGMMEIQSSEPKFLVGLDSKIFLPKEAASYIGIGETGLEIKGYINTGTMKMALAASLSSEEIPLTTDRSLVLREAQFEFAFENGKPQMAVGGQLEVRPPNEEPFQLKGDVSIDVTGKIYAQGFMTKDKPSDPEPYIRNPFGINDKIYITRAGLGFGLDFKTTPIPAPSLAIEGGIAIKNSPTAEPLFAGAVTLAVDPTEPNQTIIDADVVNAKLSYIIDAFHDKGVPSEFAETLRKINLKKLHFTVVPSPNTVELFGREYEPGFYAEGVFEYGSYTGAMLIDIDEDGVEVFGGMSPLDFTHFKLKGTLPNTGPYIYLSFKPAQNIYALAVNGKLEVLGATAMTDVYLSDRGFNATMKTKIFDLYSAEVDIAGANFLDQNGGVYAKASMTAADDLLLKISKDASDEIRRAADETKDDFKDWDAELAKYEPMYKQKGAELDRLKAQTRQKYERLCNLMNQKEAHERERKSKQKAIADLKKEVNRLQNEYDREKERSASPIPNSSCDAPGSKEIEGQCFTCPEGFEWNGPVISNNAKGCINKKLYAKAKPSGKNGPFCPEGQILNTPNMKCYVCPNGYVPTVGVVDINSSKRCILKNGKYSRPTPGKRLPNCNITDKKNGKCYTCPSGYSRNIAVDVNQRNACSNNKNGNREKVLREKRAKLATMEVAYGDFMQSVGRSFDELGGVASNICDQAKNTDIIHADPDILNSQVYKDWLAYGAIVVNAREMLKTVGDGTVGTLNAAAWFVENAGSAANVVQINSAHFEGCLNRMNGGYVTLQFRGKFADDPISGSFNINLKSPENDIKAFANALLNTDEFKAVNKNGTCTRPNVPRPPIAKDSKIAELMSLINAGTKPGSSEPKTKLKPAPLKETPPGWAGGITFTEDRFNPADFEIGVTASNPSSSSTAPVSGRPTVNAGSSSGSRPSTGSNSGSGSRPSVSSGSKPKPKPSGARPVIVVNSPKKEIMGDKIPVQGRTDNFYFDPNAWYRFTTAFTGPGKSLDVVNDEKKKELRMTPTGSYSGQLWKITPLGDGYYRLTTMFQGAEKSLDVKNDRFKNDIQLAPTGNYSGQAWKIQKLENGYFRLTTQFLGDDISLDILNNDKDDNPFLSLSKNYTGQYWMITKVK